MSTNDLTQRRNIRAVTDALAADEWIRSPAIKAKLPEPKPARTTLIYLLKEMVDAEQLVRRGTPRNYEYRSGTQPVVDGRVLRATRNEESAQHIGFMKLSRIEKEDPEKHRRIIENDKRLEGRRA